MNITVSENIMASSVRRQKSQHKELAKCVLSGGYYKYCRKIILQCTILVLYYHHIIKVWTALSTGQIPKTEYEFTQIMSLMSFIIASEEWSVAGFGHKMHLNSSLNYGLSPLCVSGTCVWDHWSWTTVHLIKDMVLTLRDESRLRKRVSKKSWKMSLPM